MSKIIKTTTLLAAVATALPVLAGYKLSMPLENNQGGSLPTNSIIFVTNNETPSVPPTTPDDELPSYKGIGTIDMANGSGFLESTTFQTSMYVSVLFRSYGDHSIYLTGNQQDLLNTAKSITLTINGDVLPCEIYDASYLAYKNQTAFHCSTTGFVGTKYSIGQQFNIIFKK